MSVALYPGSFNKWHKGHEDILDKALAAFDKVHIMFCSNPDKQNPEDYVKSMKATGDRMIELNDHYAKNDKIYVSMWSKTLVEYTNEFIAPPEMRPTVIIRGLRDSKDFDYELAQQYWNEDVGITIPFMYLGADRGLRHVSSSALRMVEGLGLEHEYGI